MFLFKRDSAVFYNHITSIYRRVEIVVQNRMVHVRKLVPELFENDTSKKRSCWGLNDNQQMINNARKMSEKM